MTKRKSEAQRQNRTKPKSLVKPSTPNVEGVPDPPTILLPHVKLWWEIFWDSPLADFMHKTDLPALHRLWINYDDLERTRAALYKEAPPKPVQAIGEGHNDFQMRVREWRVLEQAAGRLHAGSHGVAINPLLTHMRALEKNIIALEDRFGFTLRARQELGLNEMRARSLAEQNAKQIEDNDDSDEDEDDPRTVLLVPGSNG